MEVLRWSYGLGGDKEARFCTFAAYAISIKAAVLRCLFIYITSCEITVDVCGVWNRLCVQSSSRMRLKETG